MKRKKLGRAVSVLASAMCVLGFSAQGILAADWHDFRGNQNNNAVVDVLSPTTADDATLYWACKIGTGWSVAPSSPIIVDDTIVFFGGKDIYKLNAVTGEVIQQGKLTSAATSSWNITPPTYFDGKLYFSLANGQLEIMDYETLKTVEIYKNENLGQSNNPIMYRTIGGTDYVYTGWWMGDSKDADYACINADTGKEVWTFTNVGGFYWAGAYVADNFLLIGGDDGKDDGNMSSNPPLDENGDIIYDETQDYTGIDVGKVGKFYSLNPVTGETIDTIEQLDGDVRCTVVFDNGTAYFATTGGTFYAIPVNADGTFDKANMKTIEIGDRSTSTPVVYNGRAYVGTTDDAQFLQKADGHGISVIDLATMTVAYRCPTEGSIQTSGLLTTGYEESEDGAVYLYFVENYTPGKVRVIKDAPGQTEMKSVDGSFADVLFTPVNAQRQYAIGSMIADDYGTLYFKNDSGHIMALGSRITDVKIESLPTKTEYQEGETFDPAGMKVVATYANGKTRDVTEYVKYSEEPLTLEDVEITIAFDYVMYGDTDNKVAGDSVNTTGVKATPFYNGIEISVTENKAVETMELITALEKYISEENVKAARDAYDELSNYEKGFVTNYDVLVAAEKKLTENPFKDIEKNAWYEEGVLFCSWNGLMNGMSEGVFDPQGTTTRAQLVTILYRYAGSPEVSGNSGFSDVEPVNHWAKDAILWASTNGIVNGTGNGKFSPNEKVTREQLATILYRYCKETLDMDVSKLASIGSFPDAADVSSYAMQPVQWAVKQEYINGKATAAGNILAPQGDATRAEIATIMMRFVKSL